MPITVLDAMYPVEVFNLLIQSILDTKERVNRTSQYTVTVDALVQHERQPLILNIASKQSGGCLATIEIQLRPGPNVQYPDGKKAFIKERNRKLCEANALLETLLSAEAPDAPQREWSV